MTKGIPKRNFKFNILELYALAKTKQRKLIRLLYKKLHEAYYSARKHKRTKPEQLRFEYEYDAKLYELHQLIATQQYEPLPAKVFVTRKPVHREIFAPQFRDRVVHHLIYNYLYDYLDRKFIYDSYSCRVGKGTMFGIERAKSFMRKVSRNYTQDAYVLKLDISGYFMNINRKLLYAKLQQMIDFTALDITKTEQKSLEYLLKVNTLHDPTKNAIRKSPLHYWDTIPRSKSLFHTASDCGLPIGSLTSQLFSNVFLNDIDHRIKQHISHYGRYVDDMLLMHQDSETLRAVIPMVNEWLGEIGLQLHPGKIVLQHYSKGFYFLGQYIKPGCCYISRRLKKHIFIFQKELEAYFALPRQKELKELQLVENKLNSYFGVLAKANTYQWTKLWVDKLPQNLKKYMDVAYDEATQQMKASLKSAYKIKNNYTRECYAFTHL